MAKFFGTVQGGRGQATRLGHAGSGLKVSAQSWDGSVIVRLFTDDKGEANCVIAVGAGSTQAGQHYLYNGPIKNLFSDQVTLGGI
jgi:hypothetical protein